MKDQTSFIAAFLVVGFIVFITVKGEIPAYKAVLTGKPNKNLGGGYDTPFGE